MLLPYMLYGIHGHELVSDEERQFNFFALVSIAKLIFLQSSYVSQNPSSRLSITT